MRGGPYQREGTPELGPLAFDHDRFRCCSLKLHLAQENQGGSSAHGETSARVDPNGLMRLEHPRRTHFDAARPELELLGLWRFELPRVRCDFARCEAHERVESTVLLGHSSGQV